MFFEKVVHPKWNWVEIPNLMVMFPIHLIIHLEKRFPNQLDALVTNSMMPMTNHST